MSCKEYGLPFLTKRVSEYISRLQKHEFQWEDEPLDVLLEKYEDCKAAGFPDIQQMLSVD